MIESFKLLDEENFEEGVSSGLTLVDFYADWCGPCRMLTPVLEEVAKDVAGLAVIAKIDIDKAQKTASFLQVTSIPTLVLFKEGKEIGRLVGLRDKETIKEFIQTGETAQ
ncbi:MAG: Thioredoxin [Chlamydiae bacterium]|nr:Thioredoxin [Chlamydiota bacterium]